MKMDDIENKKVRIQQVSIFKYYIVNYVQVFFNSLNACFSYACVFFYYWETLTLTADLRVVTFACTIHNTTI